MVHAISRAGSDGSLTGFALVNVGADPDARSLRMEDVDRREGEERNET